METTTAKILVEFAPQFVALYRCDDLTFSEYYQGVKALSDAYAQALVRLAKLAPQPIETAPKDGSQMDLWAGRQRYPDCFYCPEKHVWVHRVRYIANNGKRITTFNQVITPTHWAPIPAPPEARVDSVYTS